MWAGEVGGAHGCAAAILLLLLVLLVLLLLMQKQRVGICDGTATLLLTLLHQARHAGI